MISYAWRIMASAGVKDVEVNHLKKYLDNVYCPEAIFLEDYRMTVFSPRIRCEVVPDNEISYHVNQLLGDGAKSIT